MLKQQLTISWIICNLFVANCFAAWNNPYPAEDAEKNYQYSAFSERPKHLDPVRSYSESEYVFLGQIYEPPLQYHYLHRPYKLIPQTLTAMPEVVYIDAQGNEFADPANKDIAYTEYRFTLQKGILYQPHPSFAKDEQGHYLYHHLSEDQTSSVKSLKDLPETGTRELVAYDYAYQIKRIANPLLHSPIYSLMKDYILGLEELATELKTVSEQQDVNYIDMRAYELEGVKVQNDYQYSVRLKGRYQQFAYWLAMPFFAPIPWEAELFYAQPGMKENNINLHWYPVGTGAYMLTENNPNLRMVLEKNPNFRGQKYPTEGQEGDREEGLLDDAGKDIPFIEKVIFNLEKESIPYWNKFLQGYYDRSGVGSDSFDQAVNIGATGNVDLTDEMKARDIRLTTVVETSIFYLGFNMLDEVVGGDSENARLLRQAISIAIDYEEYISIFANGRGLAAQGPIPPGIFGNLQGKEGINPYVYDWQNGKPRRKSIEFAKKLLEKAGYANGIDSKTGRPLILNYEAIDSGPGSKARLNWLRKQFAKLNLQLVIRSTDYNRFQEKMRSGKAQIFMWGWNADYPDPENFLFLLYGPNGKVEHHGENASNFSNKEFDQLFEKVANMPDSPERQQVINQMLEVIRYHAPWAYGFHPKEFTLMHGWYKNSKPFLMTNTGTLKYKRIDTEQRKQKREEWNQPVVWPIFVIVLLLILLIVPAALAYRRHERSRAL